MKIAIMGFGVVGSGVGEIIKNNAMSISKKVSEDIEIKYILDLRDFPDSEFKCFTKDFNDILNDDEVKLVVEVMGGTNPAYNFTKQLLGAKKHVVTSNKELVATHGTELLKIAKENNVNYMFEASVGGGIPIIRPLINCLAANEINSIKGILNGTTNYILTQMINCGESFENALKGAQKNGYAEKDPTADIEGHDTCRKTAILASLAFGKAVDSEKIPTKGITNVTLSDVALADKLGYSIKLIGSCERAENGVYAEVAPMLIEKSCILSGIDDVFNGIMVSGSFVGDAMFYGRGAGMLPTASAVVGDVIDIAKHKDKNVGIMWTESEDGYLLDCSSRKNKYFVRIKSDMAFECECIEKSCEINGEIGMIVSETTEKDLVEALKNKNAEALSIIKLVK